MWRPTGEEQNLRASHLPYTKIRQRKDRRQPRAAADFVDKINYRIDYFSGQKLPGSFIVRDYHTKAMALYADSLEIYTYAKEKGIPPELLIDEEYYYVRSGGVAPYRVVFAGYDKGMTQSAVVAAADNMFGYKIDIGMWRSFLEGYTSGIRVRAYARRRVNVNGEVIRPVQYEKRNTEYSQVPLGYLIVVCIILEIPLASLFRTVRMGGILQESDANCGRGIYSGVDRVVRMLDEADLAVLVGVGLFLSTKNAQYVREGLEGLLKWWGDKNEPRKCDSQDARG